MSTRNRNFEKVEPCQARTFVWVLALELTLHLVRYSTTAGAGLNFNLFLFLLLSAQVKSGRDEKSRSDL